MCGCCGGGYTIMGKDRYGCATRRHKGTCDNGATITRQRIEARVLSGIKDSLLAPEMVREFLKAYSEELAAADRDAGRERARLEAELADTNRKLKGIMAAIEDGHLQRERSRAAEGDRAAQAAAGGRDPQRRRDGTTGAFASGVVRTSTGTRSPNSRRR